MRHVRLSLPLDQEKCRPVKRIRRTRINKVRDLVVKRLEKGCPGSVENRKTFDGIPRLGG